MRRGRAWISVCAGALLMSACGGAAQPTATTGGASAPAAASGYKSVFTYAVNRAADDLDLVTQGSIADIWPLANVCGPWT